MWHQVHKILCLMSKLQISNLLLLNHKHKTIMEYRERKEKGKEMRNQDVTQKKLNTLQKIEANKKWQTKPCPLKTIMEKMTVVLQNKPQMHHKNSHQNQNKILIRHKILCLVKNHQCRKVRKD